MKDTVKRTKRETDWEKIFAKHTSDKGLLDKIYKERLKLKNEKTTQDKKQAKGLNLTKENTQTANKHMKRCSTSYIIRAMQIKTPKGDTATDSLQWQKIKTLTPHTGETVEQQELPFTAGGTAECYSHFGRQLGSFL